MQSLLISQAAEIAQLKASIEQREATVAALQRRHASLQRAVDRAPNDAHIDACSECGQYFADDELYLCLGAAVCQTRACLSCIGQRRALGRGFLCARCDAPQGTPIDIKLLS